MTVVAIVTAQCRPLIDSTKYHEISIDAYNFKVIPKPAPTDRPDFCSYFFVSAMKDTVQFQARPALATAINQRAEGVMNRKEQKFHLTFKRVKNEIYLVSSRIHIE